MTYPVYKTIGGHRYAYEYEAYHDPKVNRSRQRMVRYLGRCDKDGKVLAPPKVHLEGLHSSFSVGRLLVFHACAERFQLRERVRKVLGVDDEMAGHFVALVLNQATDRVADEHLPEWIRASPLPHLLPLDAERIVPETFGGYRLALCHLDPEDKVWKDRGLVLQAELTRAWRSQTREPPGAYYDVTKLAFHGWTNPYAQRGHDANGGISTVVGFGMVVSEEHHHPYLCQALPGSQNDSLSVGPTVEMLRARGYEKIQLVMDRGMISKENVDLAVREGYQLVGLVKGWDLETIALASRWTEQELEQPEHVVATSRRSVYARALTTSLFGIPKVRVAVIENPRRKAEDREGRDLALQELEGPVSKDRLKELKQQLRVQNPKLRKKKGYVPGLLVKSAGRRGFQVVPEAVERDRGLDGRFLIFSTDLSLSGPEMYRTYFARDGIEKVFRTGKGELCLGPVRHRRKDQLDAYATVFYTASLLWSWSEQTLQRKYPDMSLSEVLGLLENVAWVRFGTGKSIREWSTRLTDQQEEILSALGATRYLPTT
ncbi:transposase (IS4) [mine drainage metagenome]|uniref:Transposase (IS4) n=1 Tax=mine drainage metagenome TaxID=410659 RepID=T1C5X7_9ZZZZ